MHRLSVCVCVCSRAWRKEEKGFEEERKGGAGAWEGGQQTTGRNPGDGPGWVARGDIILNLNNPSAWEAIG